MRFVVKHAVWAPRYNKNSPITSITSVAPTGACTPRTQHRRPGNGYGAGHHATFPIPNSAELTWDGKAPKCLGTCVLGMEIGNMIALLQPNDSTGCPEPRLNSNLGYVVGGPNPSR